MIKVEHLKKYYDSFQLDCSLSVPKGCISGLIGQNGAGKSTTFKAILGLISSDDGIVEVFGEPASSFDRQKIGVVLSDSGFSGYLTIRDIALILEKMYVHFEKDKFYKLIDQFQLPIDRKIKEFSTGMKAKLKVIVAVTHQADLLILDEPTAGLDVIARDEVIDLLRCFMEEDENRSILISSHISSDLENLCDDIYLIDNGSIMFHDFIDTIIHEYGLLKMTNEQFETIDRQYLLSIKKESYGWIALTNQKQFYQENYPNLVIEKGTIDGCITLMVKGEKL